MRTLLILLLGCTAVSAAEKRFLLSGSYLATLALQAHVKAVASGRPLAICDGKLVKERPVAKRVQEKLDISSPCHAVAFLSGIRGLKAGKVPVATREGEGFRWNDQTLNPEAQIVGKDEEKDGGKEAVIRLGDHELLRTAATAVQCTWAWAGDLNRDKQLDLIADCTLDGGQRAPVTGVFLSKKKGYDVIRQTFVAGSI